MQEQETISTAIATLPPSERAAIALGSSNTEKNLREMVVNSASILTITNKAGRDECHGAYMPLKNIRCAITNLAEEVTEDAKKFTKSVKTEAERLIAITAAEEKRLLALRDDWDAKLAAEKAERERKEAERVAAIKARIAAIRAIPAGMAGEHSSEIVAELAAFRAFEVDETFAEFKGEAECAVTDTIRELGALMDKALAAEAEAARIEADRAELARLQAEMVEQKRQAAAEEAERQRVAADIKRQMEEQQAAIAAERAALQAERDALAAEKLAAIVRKQAEANQAEFDKALVQCMTTGTGVVVMPDATKSMEDIAMCAPECMDTPSVDQTVVGLPEPRDDDACGTGDARVDDTPPTLRLGQIAERLGFSLSAEFLRTLGFEPSGRSGAAMLYHEYQFPMLCAALIVHIDAAAMAIAEPVA